MATNMDTATAAATQRRSKTPRQPSRRWGLRASLAAVTAIAGSLCVAQTLAQVVARTNPRTAYGLFPDDGRIAARLAASLIGVQATATDRTRADEVARAALLKDASAVQAVSTLAVNAVLRGDVAQARRLFAYSQKLSRRDFQTQLWLIEQAVARNDIKDALRHYDIALRTNATSWELLFSVLGEAITEPAIRTALAQTLSKGPIWGTSFVTYVAGHSPDPRATAAFFTDLSRAGVDVPEEARSPIVNALIEQGALDEAWFYYVSGTPGAVRNGSRDPQFSRNTTTPSLLDWVAMNDGAIVTSIQRGDTGGVFDFAAPASVGGALLRQVQLLEPGSYRITGLSSGIAQEADATPYWALTCRADGRELGRVVLPPSEQSNGRFAGRVVVPAGCPVQVLTLIARASDAIGGLAGRIVRVQLNPEP